MLGELIGELSGKLTSVGVLPPEGGDLRFEVTAQGTGKLLGKDVVGFATYFQNLRPDRSLFCPHGHVVFTTAEGEAVYWTGFAVGRPTGKPPASALAPCGHFATTAPAFARLTGISAVSEYTANEDGSFVWTIREWKA